MLHNITSNHLPPESSCAQASAYRKPACPCTLNALCVCQQVCAAELSTWGTQLCCCCIITISASGPNKMHCYGVDDQVVGCMLGCASGEIYLCQFGETKAKAGYTPMPAHLEAPAPSPHSLFTTPPKSWNASPGVNFTHWGQPQAVSSPQDSLSTASATMLSINSTVAATICTVL